MAQGSQRTSAQLDLAREQLYAGLTDAARATAQAITDESYADDAKQILASAVAREGNVAAAVEIAASASDPSTLDGTLAYVTELQLERGDLEAARKAVRQRFAALEKRDLEAFRLQAFYVAIKLANQGAAADAIELLEQAQQTTSENLALVALRLVDHGDFAGAEQVYARILASRLPSQFWVMDSIAEGRLMMGWDPLEVLKSFPATMNLEPAVLTAARLLGRKGQLQRAGELLKFATDSAMRISGCTEPQTLPSFIRCAPVFRSSDREFYCGEGNRALGLCNIAGLQAQLGLLEDARQLVPRIDLPAARAMVLAEIAKSQFSARQVRQGHQTLASMMQAANTPPLTHAGLCIAVQAYTQRMLEAPQEKKKGPDALLVDAQQLARVSDVSRMPNCSDQTLVELAAAYAKIGRLEAAFQVAQLLKEWRRVYAYAGIYKNAP
jgi:hypothetical protein